jgi:hypothetical protein
MSAFLSKEKKTEIADNTHSILSGSKSAYKINFDNGKHKNVHIPEISIITHNQSINLNDPILNNFFDFLNDKTNLYTIDKTTNTIKIIDKDNFEILQYTKDESSKFGYVLYLTESEYNDLKTNTELGTLYSDMSKIKLSEPDTKSIESIKYSVLGNFFYPEKLSKNSSDKSNEYIVTDYSSNEIEIKNI